MTLGIDCSGTCPTPEIGVASSKTFTAKSWPPSPPNSGCPSQQASHVLTISGQPAKPPLACGAVQVAPSYQWHHSKVANRRRKLSRVSRPPGDSHAANLTPVPRTAALSLAPAAHVPAHTWLPGRLSFPLAGSPSPPGRNPHSSSGHHELHERRPEPGLSRKSAWRTRKQSLCGPRDAMTCTNPSLVSEAPNRAAQRSAYRPMPTDLGKHHDVELRGFEPRTSCMPCTASKSGHVDLSRIPGGQANGTV
jgi:hypothetical protein